MKVFDVVTVTLQRHKRVMSTQ